MLFEHMDPIYQESVDDCMAFGPDMKSWVDAYNHARMEAQRRDTVASEATRNLQNLMGVEVPTVDFIPHVVDLFPYMVEVAVLQWNGYQATFDALVVAGSLREEIVRRVTVSNLSFENIKAKMEKINVNWTDKVANDLRITVTNIQRVMKTVIESKMVIQSNHREALNKALSIIRGVIGEDTFQFLQAKETMQNLITTAEESKTRAMTGIFIWKVTDISRNWNVVEPIANVRIIAYNLQIVTHLAKDIAQLIVKATKEMELATKEKEAADWVLQAMKADAELQPIIAIEQKWIVLTLDEIQTAISAVEPLFQADDANHMGTTIQQQVSQESLRSLLTVVHQMMDFQSRVAWDAKRQMEEYYYPTSNTFGQAFTQRQLVTQMDAHRKVIQTAEHAITITRFLAKMDKKVDLARKIEEVEPRLLQARDEMKRLTHMENEIIDTKISTLIRNQMENTPLMPTISSLPRGSVFSTFYPIKPATSFATPLSIATVPSSSSTVPNTNIASPGCSTTRKMIRIRMGETTVATFPTSSPVAIAPTPTTSAQVNTEQTMDNGEKKEEKKQMAAVLIGLLNETPPTVTLPPPTEVNLKPPGMEKKQKKRKRDS
jgi:hypothetical protein